ncbi:MAG: 3-dehydroquinate synthase, partial [Anaerolineae bacterium]|nr:3-dehydroquinate synthase [Anaerolineae bacterium]
VVQEDPFEHGRRTVLNLGHTTAHALEKLSNFTIRHGEAVSIGLCVATRIGVAMGLTPKNLVERIESTLTKWGLPTRCPTFETSAIWDAMAHDKKRHGRTLRWILVHDIGDVRIHEDVPADLVQHILIEMGAKPAT